MIDNPIAALKEEFGTDLGNGYMHLTGKPREYLCPEHGVQVVALVYDPYDAPDYICVDCGERLSLNKLSENE